MLSNTQLKTSNNNLSEMLQGSYMREYDLENEWLAVKQELIAVIAENALLKQQIKFKRLN